MIATLAVPPIQTAKSCTAGILASRRSANAAIRRSGPASWSRRLVYHRMSLQRRQSGLETVKDILKSNGVQSGHVPLIQQAWLRGGYGQRHK